MKIGFSWIVREIFFFTFVQVPLFDAIIDIGFNYNVALTRERWERHGCFTLVEPIDASQERQHSDLVIKLRTGDFFNHVLDVVPAQKIEARFEFCLHLSF